MNVLKLSSLMSTLLLMACNGQTTPNTDNANNSTPPPVRKLISAVKFDSPWIKECVATQVRENNIQYADEISRLSCRGYPKAYEGFIRNTGGGDMLVASTGGLEQLTGLTELDLSDNYIAHIDLAGLKNLTRLTLSGNVLQSLDLTQYSSLKNLDVSLNPLYEIKLPTNGQLESLSLGSAADFTSAFGLSILDSLINTHREDIKDKRFFDEKTGELLSKTSFKRLDKVDFSKQFTLKSLSASGFSPTAIPLETFPTQNALEKLYLPSSNLPAVDLHKLIQLKEIDLSSNAITKLDITQNPNLTDLNLSGNHATAIKANANNQLKTLNLSNTLIPAEDLRPLFTSNTLTSVSMDNSETLPTSLAPNLEALTLNNSGQFQLSRLGFAPNLKEFTLNGGSIDRLAFINLSNLKKAHIHLSEQESNLAFSCGYYFDELEVTTNKNLTVEGQKGSEFDNLIIGISTGSKVDVSSLDAENITIATDSSYKDLALNHGAKSITLAGVRDLEQFSFYDFPNLQALKLSDTSLSSFSLKGAAQSFNQFSLEYTQINELELGGELTKLDLNLVGGLRRLELSAIAHSLKELTLYYCQIDQFNSSALNKDIQLTVLSTPFVGDSLTQFRRATGRDLTTNGDLIPLQK